MQFQNFRHNFSESVWLVLVYDDHTRRDLSNQLKSTKFLVRCPLQPTIYGHTCCCQHSISLSSISAAQVCCVDWTTRSRLPVCHTLFLIVETFCCWFSNHFTLPDWVQIWPKKTPTYLIDHIWDQHRSASPNDCPKIGMTGPDFTQMGVMRKYSGAGVGKLRPGDLTWPYRLPNPAHWSRLYY